MVFSSTINDVGGGGSCLPSSLFLCSGVGGFNVLGVMKLIISGLEHTFFCLFLDICCNHFSRICTPATWLANQDCLASSWVLSLCAIKVLVSCDNHVFLLFLFFKLGYFHWCKFVEDREYTFLKEIICKYSGGYTVDFFPVNFLQQISVLSWIKSSIILFSGVQPFRIISFQSYSYLQQVVVPYRSD